MDLYGLTEKPRHFYLFNVSFLGQNEYIKGG